MTRLCTYNVVGGILLSVLGATANAGPAFSQLADLGRALFFDTRLSATGQQSCSSCHDPAKAFSESRDSGTGGAVSTGDDGRSLGDRNAPALTYASLAPAFHQDADANYRGGFFVDGRAATMFEQAQEPILNPIEMALPDAQAVMARIRSDDVYVASFAELVGPRALESPGASLASVASAIVAFENTPEFAPFDSKYDRYLRGEAELTREEELGRVLFFSELINCNRCHLLDRREYRPGEVFTNYRYHNIGVPVNDRVRALNGFGPSHVDPGLAQNPRVKNAAEAGRFRVPSLRNVAVTGPYMHNGVFRELSTAILFYNRFLVDSSSSLTNPETGQPWGPPEVPQTVDLELLRGGQPLSEQRAAYLEAFLETLTDRRYEYLLAQ